MGQYLDLVSQQKYLITEIIEEPKIAHLKTQKELLDLCDPTGLEVEQTMVRTQRVLLNTFSKSKIKPDCLLLSLLRDAKYKTMK